LTLLPALPSKLSYINCRVNQLTALPELPPGLTYLDCDLNQLTELPELPSDLKRLFCGENQLTVMPEFPSGLEYLNCSRNQLTALLKLPSSLRSLVFDSNQLTSINVTGLTLSWLDCRYNNMTSKSKVIGFSGELDKGNYYYTPQNTDQYEPVALTVNGGTGGGSYAPGATVTITAAPAPAGQQFKQWNITPAVTFIDGTSAASQTAKFTMPAQAVTATATYEPIPTPTEPKLTVSATEGGSIIRLPLFNIGLKEGSKVTVYAFPQSGYKLARWETTGLYYAVKEVAPPAQAQSPLEFTMPAGEVTVKAVFEKVGLCTITASSEGLGLLLGAPATAYAGTTITMIAVPLWPLSRLDHWEVNGVSAGNSLILNHQVTGDVTIKAVFK
jgi:hypothetical protein